MTPVEPTEAQVAAFKAAWEAEDDRPRGAGTSYTHGDRTRAGLRAALNVADPQELPTEPYTVIRVAWRTGEDDTVLVRIPDDEYEWHGTQDGTVDAWYDSNVRELITTFEVLASPLNPTENYDAMVQVKQDTAKAVLAAVRVQMADELFRYPKTRDLRLDMIAIDFDVVS